METWFAKSLIATAAIVPAFLAIPFFKDRYGVDPLVYLVWYFMATAISIALYWASSGRASTLVPPAGALTAILLIGIFFGAFANGSLFQAMGLAPNPGLPPVIYATASLVVFGLSAALATSFPLFFKPVETDPSRLVGMVLVIGGLYLLAGGRLPGFLRGA
ncbi:MAG: hypothetical protein CMM26_14105 [Rhodospirillaceae bacterium]|jgi:hypothetical protein|nr:hypothetical protein [Rhodospirillaceae bacterium]